MPRKKSDIHYLYKTTCKVTGRYYIGMHSTSNLNDGYMGSGKRLRHSIRKYGKENHVKEIIEFFGCREDLVEAEKRAITVDLLCNKNCMNLMSGGTGGFISVEQQKRRSQSGNTRLHEKLKSNDDFYNHWKQKVIEGVKKTYQNGRNKNWGGVRFTGKKHSEETRQKMSQTKSTQGNGETNSQYGSMWITNGNENRKIKKDEVIPESWFKGRINNTFQ